MHARRVLCEFTCLFIHLVLQRDVLREVGKHARLTRRRTKQLSARSSRYESVLCTRLLGALFCTCALLDAQLSQSILRDTISVSNLTPKHVMQTCGKHLGRRGILQARAARVDGGHSRRAVRGGYAQVSGSGTRVRSARTHRAASEATALSRRRWLRAAFSRIYAASRASPTARALASSSENVATSDWRRSWLASTWRSHSPAALEAGAAALGGAASSTHVACAASLQRAARTLPRNVR